MALNRREELLGPRRSMKLTSKQKDRIAIFMLKFVPIGVPVIALIGLLIFGVSRNG